tara:strand:- start:836 stop:958 length:123 start_codon:yes stop_codon:yes gene_type:complete
MLTDGGEDYIDYANDGFNPGNDASKAGINTNANSSQGAFN